VPGVFQDETECDPQRGIVVGDKNSQAVGQAGGAGGEPKIGYPRASSRIRLKL
jgi:hypothetical protein